MYPDFAIQYAKHLEKSFLEKGYDDVRVYAVIRGAAPEIRLAARRARSSPIIAALKLKVGWRRLSAYVAEGLDQGGRP